MRDNERGNALFYILISVVLLAALSYAVSESGRGNVRQVTEEKARLLASEIIDYGNLMAQAVAQLRLRGVDDGDLCFDDQAWGASNYDHAACADNLNRIFHPDGGGFTWSRPPEDAMDDSASPDFLWHFYADNEIDQIGSTCGASACSDLVLIVDELNIDTCMAINNLLDIDNPAAAPPVDSNMGETRFTGTFGYGQTIGDEASSQELRGQSSGCFLNGLSGEYVFYKVLIAR